VWISHDLHSSGFQWTLTTLDLMILLVARAGMVRRSRYILLVDHNPDFMDVISHILTKLGHVVKGETESLKALRAFSEDHDYFDVAILDVSITEDLTGLELAQRFRRIDRDFPVVLYGNDVDRVTINDVKKAGIYWFDKPKSTSGLKRIIGQMFG